MSLSTSELNFCGMCLEIPGELQTGVVDTDTDEEFRVLFESLREMWDEREKLYNNPPEFHAWFMKYCKMEVQNTMLKPKRICCGLSSSPLLHK